MPRTSESTDRARSFDWRSWLALGWATWFGFLYVRMVLSERAPGALRAIGAALESVGIPVR